MEKYINCQDWDRQHFEELFAALKNHAEIKVVLSFENAEKTTDNWERIVGNCLVKLGVPVHLKGYGYIKTGILRCILEPEELEGVTKILYPAIAKIHHTTAGKVEHGIRHAISKAWEIENKSEWERIFGHRLTSNMGKPSNSEFLAAISDYIRINN